MSTLPVEGGDVDVAAMEDDVLDAALKGPEVEEQKPEGEEAPEDDKPKFVPHAALHEERLRRQALEREASELRNWQRQMMERINAREAAEQEAQKPKPPSVEDDPIGYMSHKLEALEGTLTQQQQLARQQAEEAQFVQVIQQDLNAFQAQTPDFVPATEFLIAQRTAELRVAGYNDAQIQQAINADAWAIRRHGLQTGQSPAKIFYEMAKARGYAVKADDTASKMAAIAKGQETSRPAGSGKAKASLTPADLLNMSDEDFDKYWDKTIR